jgi:GNAT superfamily N-acetyltransferase
MSEIVIRKAGMKDVTKIMEMWKELHRDHDQNIIKKDRRLKGIEEKKRNACIISKKWVEKHIRSRNSMVNLAYIDGGAAGYSIVSIKDHIPIFKVKKTGNIDILFVRKELRGKCIASKFKKEAFKWFRKKGVKYASLQVFKQNHYAKNIYKKWGFFDGKVEMWRKI